MIIAQRLVLCTLCLLMPVFHAAAEDIVVRRNGAGTLRGEIILMDDAGVTIRIGTGTSHLVPWDRVRRIESPGSMRQVREMMELGEKLWRARSRLERGDNWLAEPIFDELFPRYRGQTNEVALIIVEGLLRCKLARQAHVEAVLPAIEMIRLRRSGVETDRYQILPSVWHAELALCPALPPFWAETRGLDALERELTAYEAVDDEVTSTMAALYLAAVQMARGEQPALPLTINLPRHPGVEFFRDLLAARERDAERHTTAQVRLMRRVDDFPEWTEAWARYSIGLAMLEESEDRPIERGLVHLAHVPARFGATQPYLAGLALHEMVMTLDARGEDAAPGLRLELERRFPHHPILDGHATRGVATRSTSAR